MLIFLIIITVAPNVLINAQNYVEANACLFVCPLADLNNHMLPLAVTRSTSDDNAINYVLPILWLTSCFHVME